jgi:uncharacterized membrane protein SpoIIM required for sporulation
MSAKAAESRRLQRWLKARGETWGRIARELKSAPRGLSAADAERHVRDYRALAQDVAIARRSLPGSSVTLRLESLFRGLHTRLHRDYEPVGVRLRRLYAVEVPQSLRELRGALLAVAALFTGAALAAAWLVASYPELAGLFASESMIRTVERHGLWTDDVFNVMPSSVAALRILGNNIVVALTGFVLGVFYGIGTLYIVLLNGAMLGGIFAFTARNDVAGQLLSFILPHGVVELSVILLAAAAGLRLGEALARPGQYSRVDAMQAAMRRAGILLAVVVPALVMAGFIEACVSPNPGNGWAIRIAVAACSGFLLWAALAGKLLRPQRSVDSSGP